MLRNAVARGVLDSRKKRYEVQRYQRYEGVDGCQISKKKA